MVSGLFREPSLYPEVFVRRVVVYDQVHVEVFRDVLIDVIEKLQKLLVAVPALALRQDFTRGKVQGVRLVLPVDAKHHRRIRRIQIQPTMSRTFSVKKGSLESLKCF